MTMTMTMTKNIPPDWCGGFLMVETIDTKTATVVHIYEIGTLC